MNRKEQEMSRMLILSPLDGRVIPLEEVPDEVFADKVLGDGAAVIPENGNIYSPIDGEIVSIPESLHAYGIRSDAGIEMIVHFGLETVNLKGEGFSPKVKVGDRVKAGQLLCTADMDFLKSKGINTVTPVLVTDGAEEGSFSVKTGEIRHGEEIMTAEISVDAAAAADGDAQKADPSDSWRAIPWPRSAGRSSETCTSCLLPPSAVPGRRRKQEAPLPQSLLSVSSMSSPAPCWV